jgi:ABC-type transport system substrate-binding protein
MPVSKVVIRSLLAAIVAAVAPKGLAADWADPAKVLKIAFPIDVSGLDPAGTQETYGPPRGSADLDALYVGLSCATLPLAPSIATGMEVSDGRIWTIHIRQGIYFADDPAFGGRKRELTAADFVYAWKRVVDPRVRSPNSDLLEHKLAGLDAAVDKAKASGRFDYDAPIQGVQAPERYTLRLELVQPDYTFLELLDSAALRAVAREVIEKYADESGRAMHHPVGTGPYRLKEWTPARRIILEANPGYREERFPPAPANADAATRAVADSMKGKRRPQIGRIEISVIEETNPRLLMFSAGQLDLDVPADVAPKMIDGKGNLLPEFAARGIRLERATELAVTFAYFNMDDPVVGGYSPDKIALRRAVCSAYNLPDEIRVIRNGQALPATQPSARRRRTRARLRLIALRPCDRPGAARQVRLSRPRWRRHPRIAGWQAAGHSPDPASVRCIGTSTTQAAKHARGRHPHGFQIQTFTESFKAAHGTLQPRASVKRRRGR